MIVTLSSFFSVSFWSKCLYVVLIEFIDYQSSELKESDLYRCRVLLSSQPLYLDKTHTHTTNNKPPVFQPLQRLCGLLNTLQTFDFQLSKKSVVCYMWRKTKTTTIVKDGYWTKDPLIPDFSISPKFTRLQVLTLNTNFRDLWISLWGRRRKFYQIFRLVVGLSHLWRRGNSDRQCLFWGSSGKFEDSFISMKVTVKIILDLGWVYTDFRFTGNVQDLYRIYIAHFR